MYTGFIRKLEVDILMYCSFSHSIYVSISVVILHDKLTVLIEGNQHSFIKDKLLNTFSHFILEWHFYNLKMIMLFLLNM